jgi:hypothetical protein
MERQRNNALKEKRQRNKQKANSKRGKGSPQLSDWEVGRNRDKRKQIWGKMMREFL